MHCTNTYYIVIIEKLTTIMNEIWGNQKEIFVHLAQLKNRENFHEFFQSFFFGFLGLRERDFALHNGQIGALRWICWWHDKQDFIGGGCCLENKNFEN